MAEDIAGLHLQIKENAISLFPQIVDIHFAGNARDRQTHAREAFVIHLVYAPDEFGKNLRAVLVGDYHGAKQILEVSENRVDIADALRSLLTEVSARLQNELGDGIAEFIKAATAAQ